MTGYRNTPPHQPAPEGRRPSSGAGGMNSQHGQSMVDQSIGIMAA